MPCLSPITNKNQNLVSTFNIMHLNSHFPICVHFSGKSHIAGDLHIPISEIKFMLGKNVLLISEITRMVHIANMILVWYAFRAVESNFDS